MLSEPDAVARRLLSAEAKIAVLEGAIASLTVQLEELQSRLKMNSRNSSKPPSSDGLNKPAPKSLRKKSSKKTGGQPGHEGKTLEPVKQPDHIHELKLENCPESGVALNEEQIVGTLKRQVFDLPSPKLEVTEYIAYIYELENGQQVRAHFPEGVDSAVQYGFRFQAWLVYLSDYQLIPLRRIRCMCADLFGYSVSEATVVAARERCAANLNGFMEVVGKRLGRAAVLHADETGMRVEGKTAWLHSLSNSEYTLYHIDPKRGYDAIEQMRILENYSGFLVHDFWSPYFRLSCKHAMCNQHIVRELTFFEEKYSWASALKTLLLDCNKEPGSKSLEQWHEQYSKLVKDGYAEIDFKPKQSKQQRGRAAKPKELNLLERLYQHENKVLTFAKEAEVPFTNNQAEQDVRMAKVKQKVSGSFRSWSGAKLFASIRSYISTSIKQGHGVFTALQKAMQKEPILS